MDALTDELIQTEEELDRLEGLYDASNAAAEQIIQVETARLKELGKLILFAVWTQVLDYSRSILFAFQFHSQFQRTRNWKRSSIRPQKS